ncbi:hypothetical protein C9374_004955 [Naegleria lovaniensis]|uniref:Endopeptidase S2P n=1 Tax=Naegleria lovaniensis TaxID=51637 RepID=A0AA88GR54_NAELO|nr:uncharacterized protein C9374_004955 [Naegleria lovaniensis]KAG2382988.1 hypothetical protein C9374_004955 [Naegleria lovaniensis]
MFEHMVHDYGLLILLLLGLTSLWWIPLLYKLIQGDHKYSEMCSRWNIIENGMGYMTLEWNSFSKYLPKQLSSSRPYLNGILRGIFNMSFGFGALMSVMLGLLCALFLVLHLIYFVFSISSSFASKYGYPSQNESDLQAEASPSFETSMVMLIPGVNLPFNQISLLIVSLIICVIVHEYGHAIAADYQDLRIETFGFSIHYILPSAYVSIETESLEKKPLFARMMIYCGGVWHNILLCFFIGILIFVFFNPSSSYFSLIERPFDNNGVFVKSVDIDNPLYHDLKPNDIILSINNIPMKDVSTFTGSYDRLRANRGFLVSAKVLSEQDELYNKKCCLKESDDDGGRLLCFKFANNLQQQGVCMKVRDVTTNPSCSINIHKARQELEQNECMVPDVDNGLFILRLKVLEKETDLIYFGTMEQFYHQVIVSDVKVKDSLSYLISLDFVSDLKKLLEYTIALSLGLAVFNLAPVEFLDGAKIYEVLFLYYLRRFAVKKEDMDHVKTTYDRLLSVFKVVLVLNICVAFINAFRVAI